MVSVPLDLGLPERAGDLLLQGGKDLDEKAVKGPGLLGAQVHQPFLHSLDLLREARLGHLLLVANLLQQFGDLGKRGLHGLLDPVQFVLRGDDLPHGLNLELELLYPLVQDLQLDRNESNAEKEEEEGQW